LVLGGSVSPDTRLRWTLADPRVTGLTLYRRRADSLSWQRLQPIEKSTQWILKDVVPDNHVFALATVDAEGNESLPTYPTKLE
jgi:hypothetical protein